MLAAAQLPASEASPQARNPRLGDFCPAFNDNVKEISSLGPESRWGTENLDYMHARYYNPQLGRFLSPDIADAADPSEPPTWNRYAYARNNPVNMVDPDGQVAIFTQEQMARNAEIRANVQAKLSAIPLIGRPLAAAADMVLSNYLPSNFAEHEAALQAAVFSAVRLPTSANIGKLGQKLENIFQQNLTRATATAAGIESRGGVVALKATGEAFDHIRKFDEARAGVAQALDALKGILANPGLTDRERAFAQYLLSRFSKE